LTVHELATEIAVDHLVRSRGELHGELRVQCGMDGIRARDGNVHQARFNLTSTTARASVSKHLTARAAVDLIDWLDLLEGFCRQVLNAEREGDPIEEVGGDPMPLGVSTRIDPIMPLGDVTTLYGDGSTGKSTLAAAIAVSVQTGVSVIPGWTPRKAPVLYLDWEAGRSSINRRVAGVAMGANIPGPVTISYRNCKRRGALPGFAEDLAREVDERRFGLVIVDSVGMASGVGEGGDANETAIRLFGAFGALGTTVLAIDHVNKTDATRTDRTTRAYGSVYKGLLARATYEIRRGKAADGRWLIAIRNTKFNDGDELGDQALKVHHEPNGAIWYERLEQLPAEMKIGEPTIWELAAEVLEAGDYGEAEIAAAIEKPVPTVRSTLYRMSQQGAVERLPSSKKWRLIRRAEAAS
jgi:hypothetical protein